MASKRQSIREFRAALASSPDPSQAIAAAASAALIAANQNESRNTYLWRDPEWTMAEAHRVARVPATNSPGPFGDGHDALWGVHISVKDCFDLAGSPTSCGTTFYRDLNPSESQDSWLVEHLRAAGAVITGKTHLHPLAYGITGENPDYGDALQPGNPGALTGGSSSGAAASVMEGSALAAIGTDTGGSVRVPAALCGLAGYRASLGRGDWRGAAHLAPTFDTYGWLFNDLEDGALLASTFSPVDLDATPPSTFAVIDEAFLHDCEPEVVASLRACRIELEALGLAATVLAPDWWGDSIDIFAPIQASEAALIHRGNFAHFETSIRQRLEWGSSIGEAAIATLRNRHAAFRNRMDDLLAQHALLLMPAAPVVRLDAGADHSQTRTRLLRYTTPVSLAGMPAITIPFVSGATPAGGMQLAAAREHDSSLLALAAALGRQRKSAAVESASAS